MSHYIRRLNRRVQPRLGRKPVGPGRSWPVVAARASGGVPEAVLSARRRAEAVLGRARARGASEGKLRRLELLVQRLERRRGKMLVDRAERSGGDPYRWWGLKYEDLRCERETRGREGSAAATALDPVV